MTAVDDGVSDALLLRQELERRQRWLDRVVAAPGPDARRAEAIDAMNAEGNFRVRIDGQPPITLAAFTKYLIDHLPLPGLEPLQVRPC